MNMKAALKEEMNKYLKKIHENAVKKKIKTSSRHERE